MSDEVDSLLESSSEDELEDELDDNLNEIGDVAKRLKNLGMAMGQELDQQNARIDRLGDKAGGLDQRLFSTTERVCCFDADSSARGVLTYFCSLSALSRRITHTRAGQGFYFSSDLICIHILHIVHSWTVGFRNGYT